MFLNFKRFYVILMSMFVVSSFQLFSMEKEEQINESNKFLFDGVRSRDLKLVEQALKQGADVNAIEDGQLGNTPLTLAAFFGNLEIVKMLLAYGANVNAKGHHKTALMLAAAYGYLDVVKELISQGADVNAVDDRGFTALMSASSKSQLDIVKLLLQFGVDVNTSTKEYTALSLVILHLFFKLNNESVNKSIIKYLVVAGADAQSSLEKAREYGIEAYKKSGDVSKADEQRIDEKMLVADADIREGRKIFKEIFKAAKNGDVSQITEFINQGFTLYIQDKWGNTPLHYAVRNNDLAMINIILQHPFAYRLLGVKNEDGHTPIHLAADKRDLLEILLAKFFGKKRTAYEDEL